jgi:hypothetical protein
MEVLRHIEPRIVPNVEVVGGTAVAATVRPTLGRSPSGARPSPRPLEPSSKDRDASRIEKAPAPRVHRLGTACGSRSEPQHPGGVRRWKAPRVQRNALSFAGGCGRRPYPTSPRQWARRRRRRESVARQASSNRIHDGGSGGVGVSSRRSPRARDMRCPSRSGWGEAFTASDRGGRCRASRPSCLGSRPLARDLSAGRAYRKVA